MEPINYIFYTIYYYTMVLNKRANGNRSRNEAEAYK